MKNTSETGGSSPEIDASSAEAKSKMPTASQFASALAPLASNQAFQGASSMEKDAILTEKVAQWDDLKRAVGGNMRWFIGVLKTWLRPEKTPLEITSGIIAGIESLWDGLGKGKFPWVSSS